MNLINELNLNSHLVKLGNDKTFISVDGDIKDIDLDYYINDFMNKSQKLTSSQLKKITLYDFLLDIYDEDIVLSIVYKFGYKGEFWSYSAYDALRAFRNDMNPDNIYCGLKKGVDKIIDGLIDRLNDNVVLINKMYFNGYSYKNSKFIVNATNLKTKEIIDFNSKKLILALPKNQIENQPQFQSKRMRQLIHSVKPVAFCRTYAVYNKDKTTGKYGFMI